MARTRPPHLRLIQTIGNSYPFLNLATAVKLPYGDILLYADAFSKGFHDLNCWERIAVQKLADQFAKDGEYQGAFLQAYNKGRKDNG
jgi:hypothetical protein